MKTVARILITGCALAFSASAFSQAPPAKSPVVHQSEADLLQKIAGLQAENASLRDNLLMVSMQFSTFKERALAAQKESLDGERKQVISSLEATYPGHHWDEQSGRLVANDPPASAPGATPLVGIGATPTPAAIPAPKK